MEKTYIPTNLEEAFQWLDEHVSDKEVFIKEDEITAVALCHHGLGRWLRNNWGLWKEDTPLAFYFISHGVKHADDMSGIILRSYWRFKNHQPIRFDEQVQFYKNYWKENGDLFRKEDEGIG